MGLAFCLSQYDDDEWENALDKELDEQVHDSDYDSDNVDFELED